MVRGGEIEEETTPGLDDVGANNEGGSGRGGRGEGTENSTCREGEAEEGDGDDVTTRYGSKRRRPPGWSVRQDCSQLHPTRSKSRE